MEVNDELEEQRNEDKASSQWVIDQDDLGMGLEVSLFATFSKLQCNQAQPGTTLHTCKGDAMKGKLIVTSGGSSKGNTQTESVCCHKSLVTQVKELGHRVSPPQNPHTGSSLLLLDLSPNCPSA